MINQQAIVDQIVQNLAFEVEAVPRNKSIRATSISQSTPLNVKIKVRKKDEIHVTQHDLFSIAGVDDTSKAVQKIRLVNSDRTIMTFDVLMEAEFEKKPQRKLHKHIFDMLKPGICLGAMDDEEHPYKPSSSYSARITEPSTASRSNGTMKQTFTLSKNAYQNYTVSTRTGEQKWLFGKCKRGGCLDPPFSEDKYSYKPSTKTAQAAVELQEDNDAASDNYYNKTPIPQRNEEAQKNGRHSSIFDSGKLKKKQKPSDKSTDTKSLDETESILNLYQVASGANSVSTHSDSIITYPPKINSDPKINGDKTVKSREPSEDKSKKSFNDHSEPLFTRPKGFQHIKEKDTLSSSDYLKHHIPIPIPVPIPIMSKNEEPEVISTNDDILETQDDDANITESDSVPDHELQEEMNLKDVEEPSIPSEIGDQDLDGTKLQPVQEIDSENNTEETELPEKPISFSAPNLDAAVDSKTINNNLHINDLKSPQSKQSFETKSTPEAIKTIDQVNKSEEKESTNETPNSQYNDTEADAIPKNVRAEGQVHSDQTSDTEKPVTEEPIMTDYITRDSKEKDITEITVKPTTQNDDKDKDTTTTKYTEVNSNVYEIPDTDTHLIISSPNKDIDLGDHKDETPSGSEYKTGAVNDETLGEPHSKITDSLTKFINEGSTNFIAPPVVVDNTELTENIESQVNKAHSVTNSNGKPITTDHDFDPGEIKENGETHSTVSRELIGTKSVIYDADGSIPSTTPKKSSSEGVPSSGKGVVQPAHTFLPSIQSTSTLKCAMKKDTLLVDLGFYSYLNDKNERILQTFDVANASKRSPNNSVTVLKSQIRISSHEIRIPVDSEHDMSIQIKKANTNQRVSISESRYINVIDNGRVKKQRSPLQCTDANMKTSETKANDNILESGVTENATNGNLIDYYEQELVPLQLIIKDLRDEIDVLATQQLMFKDKLLCPNKSKLPRLVHGNKKCFGCIRK